MNPFYRISFLAAACLSLAAPAGLAASAANTASATSTTSAKAASTRPAATGIKIVSSWARETMPGQPTAVIYLHLENNGSQADALLKLATPAAESVEIHTMSTDKGMMRMREMDDLPLPAHGKVEMTPGNGPHVMLLGLKAPLKAMQIVPLTLEFKQAGKVEIQVKVKGRDG